MLCIGPEDRLDSSYVVSWTECTCLDMLPAMPSIEFGLSKSQIEALRFVLSMTGE